MKKAIIAAVIAIYFLSISAFAQVKPSLNNHMATARTTTGVEPTRSRTTSTETKPSQPATVNRESASSAPQTWGNAELSTVSERPRTATRNGFARPATISAPPTNISAPTASTAPTQTYRVGVGDVLDIQIPESMSARSTLYTVREGGFLDYPLAGASLQVAGMTTDVIAQRLRASIKVLDNPKINVRVRDYASHSVNVIGFVSIPGPKLLRREAVPLYVVLSEAMPLPDAASVTIVRDGRDFATVNLRDQNATSQLVVANDTLKVSGAAVAASEFYFAGGEVNAPGQKAFHSGLTLTQAVIASGGASRNAGTFVRVSRQSTDGRLLTVEYNLKNIQSGKTPDPLVQKGDRIEVTRTENPR